MIRRQTDCEVQIAVIFILNILRGNMRKLSPQKEDEIFDSHFIIILEIVELIYFSAQINTFTDLDTHTHIYIYLYIY